MIKEENKPAGLRRSTILGNLSWGVADITEVGMGGIGVVLDGCLASSEANILFFSHSLLLPEEETYRY